MYVLYISKTWSITNYYILISLKYSVRKEPESNIISFQEHVADCFKSDKDSCPLHYYYNTKAKVANLVNDLNFVLRF